MDMPILKVQNINKVFYKKSLFKQNQEIQALKNINIELKRGVTLGIVGESGCGKSTLANILMGLINESSGEILFKNKQIRDLNIKDKLKIQMIFQDPHSSLNPRKKIWKIIAEPLIIHSSLSKKEIKMKVKEVLSNVGMNEEDMDKYPHMFSGGQKQRIGIARALILKPEILICDEPVSALDVSVQAQIINLLNKLKKELKLTLIFISHDLNLVKYFCEQIIVIYLGCIVEQASTNDLFEKYCHPYTQLLLASSPNLFKKIEVDNNIQVEPNYSTGCNFLNRCSFVSSECKQKEPLLNDLSHNIDSKEPHLVSCYNYIRRN